MNVKSFVDKTEYILCPIALFLLECNFLLYSFFEYVYLKNIVRLSIFFVLGLMLAVQLYKKTFKWSSIPLFGISFFLLVIHSSLALNLLFILLLVLAFHTVEERYFYKTAFLISALLTVVVLVCLLVGWQTPWVYTDPDTLRTRNTLGFTNVNSASIFFFSLMISSLFAPKRVTFWHLGAVTVGSVILFIITDSRTPLLGMLLLLFIYLLLPRIPQKWSLGCFYTGVILLFATAFLWALPFVNTPIINSLLSERPRHFIGYIQQQNVWSFFIGGSNTPEIDNLYLILLYNVGIFLYGFICWILLKAGRQLIKSGRYLEISFVTSMLICGIFEATLLRPELICAPLFWVICSRDTLNRSKLLLLKRKKPTVQENELH